MAKKPTGGKSKRSTKTSAAGEEMSVSRPFKAGMHREGRSRGFMVAFSFSSDAQTECARIYKQDKRIIRLLTVQEILDEEHVQKM